MTSKIKIQKNFGLFVTEVNTYFVTFVFFGIILMINYSVTYSKELVFAKNNLNTYQYF